MLVHFNSSNEKSLAESTGSINARFKLAGNEYDCTPFARFISRLEKVNGEWKMLSLDAMFERDTIAPVHPMDSPPARLDVEAYRPSYRCIAWQVASKGFQVSRDLPGTDRPELVKRLIDESYKWIQP
ncbi:hypothetical protein N7448_000298 [Penicillium atrosanguineum]|nr:hypothetical protein N7448_000298 [Penicillium atrosanguineum]